MTPAPIIPFLVSPYPDELLGSWLFRMQTHNHDSVIAALTDHPRKRGISSAVWRDIAHPTRELQRLLKALGMTYSSTMLSLTTYPYWLRFHSDSAFDLASTIEESDLPNLILRNRQGSLPRLHTLLPTHAKVCPLCLAEDFEKFGEPYLHRAHQLPFVSVCHLHQCALVSSCPACKQVFHADSTFIYARIACTCKFELRRHSAPKQKQHKTWEHFSCFSAEVLFSKLPIAECSHMYQFLDARLTEADCAQTPKFFRHLKTHYGEDEAKAFLILTPQRSDAYAQLSNAWITKREFRAPQICAFFATLDSSFLQNHGQFLTYARTAPSINIENETGSAHSNNPKLPRSVAQARSFVFEVQRIQGKSVTRTILYRRYKTLFWYLVLFDRAWFDEHYPNGGRRAPLQIPSIEEDRESILLAIGRASKSNMREWFNLSQQECFRAGLRDSAWLEKRKQDTAKAIKLHLVEKKRQYLETYVKDIQQAKQRLTAIYGNSARISIADIAPYSTMGERQLRYLLSCNPDLRKELDI